MKKLDWENVYLLNEIFSLTGRERESKVTSMSELDYQGFKLELQQASSVVDVLNVYLFMNKENVNPNVLDKIALKLLEFEDGNDKAMSFIEMAEKRRSDELLVERIEDKIGDINTAARAFVQKINTNTNG